MSRRSNKHGQMRYTAELRETQPDDRLVFVVSTGRSYYWRRRLQALLTRVADRNVRSHRIPSLKSSSQEQHNIASATFLVAGLLQRYTFYIKLLGKMLRFEAVVQAKLESQDASWEAYIRQHVCFQGEIKSEHDRWQRDYLLQLQEKLIETIRRGGDWKEVYRTDMFEFCSEKAKATGDKWVEHLEESVKVTNQKTHEYSDTSVFYRDGNLASGLNVVRWEEMIAHQDFEEKRRLVQEAFDRNMEGYRDVVLQTTDAYLNSFIQENRRKCGFPEEDQEDYEAFYDMAREESIRYVLEESAAFWILMKSGKVDGLAYPFTKVEEERNNSSLYHCIVQLCKIVKRRARESDDNSVNVRPVSIVYETQNILKNHRRRALETGGEGSSATIPCPVARRRYRRRTKETVVPMSIGPSSRLDPVVAGIFDKFVQGLGAVCNDPQSLSMYLAITHKLLDAGVTGVTKVRSEANNGIPPNVVSQRQQSVNGPSEGRGVKKEPGCFSAAGQQQFFAIQELTATDDSSVQTNDDGRAKSAPPVAANNRLFNANKQDRLTDQAQRGSNRDPLNDFDSSDDLSSGSTSGLSNFSGSPP